MFRFMTATNIRVQGTRQALLSKPVVPANRRTPECQLRNPRPEQGNGCGNNRDEWCAFEIAQRNWIHRAPPQGASGQNRAAVYDGKRDLVRLALGGTQGSAAVHDLSATRDRSSADRSDRTGRGASMLRAGREWPVASVLLSASHSSDDVGAKDGGGAQTAAEERSGDAEHGDILAREEDAGYGRSGTEGAEAETRGRGGNAVRFPGRVVHEMARRQRRGELSDLYASAQAGNVLLRDGAKAFREERFELLVVLAAVFPS